MKKHASPVKKKTEYRVLAFGAKTEKIGGLVKDDELISLFKKMGFLRANNTLSNEMFMLVCPQEERYEDLVGKKCSLIRVDGPMENSVGEGEIFLAAGKSDYTGPYIYVKMSGRQWMFDCDRNPRLPCERNEFSSYNGTNRSMEFSGYGQVFGEVVVKPSAKTSASSVSERKEEKPPELPLSKLNISVPRASDVKPIVPSRTNRFEQMKTAAPAKPVPALAPAPKPVVNGHGTNGTPVNGAHAPARKVEPPVQSPSPASAPVVVAPAVPAVKATPAGPNPVLLNARKHVLIGGSGEMLVEVCRVRPFKPTIDQPSFKGQPRDYFDPNKLKKIANSIKKYGQKTPVSAMPVEDSGDGVVWEIIDGERRLRAIIMLGLKHIKIALDVPGSKQEQHMSALIQNFCREGHTPMELSNAIADQVNAGQTLGDIADALSIRYSLVSNLHALQRLEPSLKPLLDPPTPAADRIRLQEGIMLSRIAVDQQVRIWNIAKLEKSRNLVRVKIAELGKEHVVQKRTEKPSHVSQRLERRLKILLASTSELQHWTPEELAVALGHLGPANTERFMRQLDLHITHIQDMKALFEKVKKSLLVK